MKDGTVHVGDIMTREVMTVRVEATAADAIARLLGEQVGGAPVLDGERLVGVISKTDLLGVSGDAKVGELMTRGVHFVLPSDPVEVAIDVMLDEAIHRLVVVDPTGKLVGMVTPIDCLRAIQRGDSLHLPPTIPREPADRLRHDEGGF